jgi:hypothetical protein
MAVAYRGMLVGDAVRLQMGLQRLNNFLHRSSPQPLLLGSAPGIGLAGPTTWGGGSQIFTHVKKVAQKDSLFLEHFLTLKPDPFGSVPQAVDLTVQSPAGLPRAVPPAPPGIFDRSEGPP